MMSRCQEKGRSALHRDHTYMWGFRGSEGQPFLNCPNPDPTATGFDLRTPNLKTKSYWLQV